MSTFAKILAEVAPRPPTGSRLEDWQVRAINAHLDAAFAASGYTEALGEAFRAGASTAIVKVTYSEDGQITYTPVTDFRAGA